MQPTAFISYSWDNLHEWNEQNEDWVAALAKRLEMDAINISLDKWSVQPGDSIPQFMEKAIVENDKILIICTPRYKYSSDNRKGAVGYESHIISSLILQSSDHRKFITVIKQGDEKSSVPTGLIGKYHICLNETATYEKQYKLLVDAIKGCWNINPNPIEVKSENLQPATSLNLSFSVLQSLDKAGIKTYIDHYKKAIKSNHQNAAAWFGLGLCTLHYASYEATILHFEKAISLQYTNADYHYYLAVSLCRGHDPAQLSADNIVKVLNSISRALAINDEQAKYHFFLLILHYEYYEKNRKPTPYNTRLIENAFNNSFKDINELNRLINIMKVTSKAIFELVNNI